jgi:hypothetical protein
MAFRQLTSLALSFADHIKPVDGSIHTIRVGLSCAIARSGDPAETNKAVVKATSRNERLVLIAAIVVLLVRFCPERDITVELSPTLPFPNLRLILGKVSMGDPRNS